MIHSNNETRRSSRKGFTLIELLVATAICVVIMAVLGSVFSTGIGAIRQIRSQGDMMDQLRSSSEVIKRDLRPDHFLSNPVSNGIGERTRLSELRFAAPFSESGPTAGFFKIYSQNYTKEGTDSDGIDSYRAVDHYLHFTSIASGNQDANHYSATLSNGTVVTSPAAEIAYFVIPDPGRSTGGGNGYAPQQTYLLIRRQKLIAVNDAEAARIKSYTTIAPIDPNVGDVISMSGGNVNKLTDVVSGNRMALAQLTGNRYGDDILLSNVLSFQVKVLANTPSPFAAVAGADTDHPYQYFGGTFDTGTNPAPTSRIRGLKITIRVYDQKMQAARQITMIQDQ